jgi:thiamine-phosphate pyrophosphorylase
MVANPGIASSSHTTGRPPGAAPSARRRRVVDISVYVVLDPTASGGRPLVEIARAAVAGGASILQYRDKHAATGTMVATTRALMAALAGSGVPLVVNDRVDVALASGADGVHVGQDDMTVADARRLLGPDAIIGLSLNAVGEADAADLDALDYVVGQCAFATASKADAPPPIGVAGIAKIATAIRRRDSSMPVGAISGITAANAASVISAGIDGVAVISAVGAAPDPAAATRALRRAVDAARTRKTAP